MDIKMSLGVPWQDNVVEAQTTEEVGAVSKISIRQINVRLCLGAHAASCCPRAVTADWCVFRECNSGDGMAEKKLQRVVLCSSCASLEAYRRLLSKATDTVEIIKQKKAGHLVSGHRG